MEYFEELADLIEEERELEFEEVFEAVKNTSPENMGELTENYMEDLQSAIPDEEQELYLLAENIKSSLLLLCESFEEESSKQRFAEQLCKFKNWYTAEDLCITDGERSSVLHALATNRANKITGEKSIFDFTGALDYDLDDLEMSLGAFNGIDIVNDPSKSEKADKIH